MTYIGPGRVENMDKVFWGSCFSRFQPLVFVRANGESETIFVKLALRMDYFDVGVVF